MDDLLIFIRSLLVNDSLLQSIVVDAGQPRLSVVDEAERTLATYPKIILTGDDGQQMEFGENAPPKFFDGRVRVEIIAKKSKACPEPLGVVRAMQTRMNTLLLGDGTDDFPGVKGQQISGTYNVTRWCQTNPTRTIPDPDPEIKRHITSFAVQYMRRRHHD